MGWRGYPQNAGILVVLVALIKQMPGAGLCCLLVFLGLYCLVQSLTSAVGVLASKSASISSWVCVAICVMPLIIKWSWVWFHSTHQRECCQALVAQHAICTKSVYDSHRDLSDMAELPSFSPPASESTMEYRTSPLQQANMRPKLKAAPVYIYSVSIISLYWCQFYVIPMLLPSS